MAKVSQHVMPSRGGWTVRAAGSSRASGTFATQQEAIDNAKATAERLGAELYIHGLDGKIRERRSFSKANGLPSRG